MIRTMAFAASLAGAFSLAVSTSVLSADCQPSKWGADDELGGANYVSPASVLDAVKLVVKGETHPLGIVVEPGVTPAFPPRTTSLQIVQPGQQYNNDLTPKFGWPVVYNDDLSQLWWGVGPQIDGLGHLGESGLYYNCNKGTDFAALTGLTKMGVHNIPPMVGRGVMIDMAKHFGVETLESGQSFGSSDIQAAAAAQGVEIREGDVVLFHTGWTDAHLKSDPTKWVSSEPGMNNEAAVYLASLNPMAVGADQWGVDVVPPAPGDRVFYAHVTFLKEHGIYMFETMNTGRLAREGVHEFLFVLGQARIKGTVQMIINPVAMW